MNDAREAAEKWANQPVRVSVSYQNSQPVELPNLTNGSFGPVNAFLAGAAWQREQLAEYFERRHEESGHTFADAWRDIYQDVANEIREHAEKESEQ